MIFNRTSISRLFLAGLVVSAVSIQPAQAGKLYKWVDEKGTVHYSDKLPPEAAQQAHEKLNARGRTTERVKDPQEEIEEEVVDTAEEQERRRQAEIEAKERMRDRILLDTFTTERDLKLTREDRLTAIDSMINLMKSNSERTKGQVSEVQAEIDKLNAKKREVPADLLKRFNNLNDQLTKDQEYIAQKEKERLELVEQFDADLQRFRELKGIQAPAEVDPKLTDSGMTTSNPPPPSAPEEH